jgi:NAD(P)-dependent dehydrogenase (short-subunit alcohol dehydrogenase family)
MSKNGNRRVWFVTGASSGFGQAIAREVLARGDRLVATGRDPDALQPLVREDSSRAMAIGLDITDASAVREAVDEAVSRFGRIDVVVNNAGYVHVGAVEELDDQEWRQLIDTDLFGSINVTRAVLPHMRGQRSGHLVQMSSLNGIEGLPGGGYYAASKFALEGLSESLADEVAPLGIKVTIVEPGPHRTGLLGGPSAKSSAPIRDYADSVGAVREQLEQLDGQQPGDPERAARAIVDTVEAPDPPRRLPLGTMALDHIRAKLKRQLDELEAWAELSASSDFPPREQAGARSG